MKKIFFLPLFIIPLFLFIFVGNKPSPFNQFGPSYESDGKRLSNGQCEGTEKRKLTTLPMRYEDFAMIIPYGLVIDDHVTPIDHQYFSPTIFRSQKDTYEVRAMADSTIVDIQPRVRPEFTEYRLVFSISCKLFYYYDLVTSLTPDILEVYKASQEGSYRKSFKIPVKAGQVIGRIGGQTLDFAVWDMDVNLKGFIKPESYKEELWKIHTVDPLDYYTDDLKKLAISKYIRTVPPISGKIDYDIDGRLVGNWFQQGTNGYGGLRDTSLSGYSRTHLAIVPDHIDPSLYIASFGNFGGKFEQLAIDKNAVKPENVSKESGIIKYDLYQIVYRKSDGQIWDNSSFAKNIQGSTSFHRGCVIFQLISNRVLKMEDFPNISCTNVPGFTARARVYER